MYQLAIHYREQIGDHMEQISFVVTNLGKADVFLGYEWLQYHNPSINWKTLQLVLDRCQTWYKRVIRGGEPEEIEDDYDELEEGEKYLFVNLEEKAWRRVETKSETVEKEFEKRIPQQYWQFKELVFDKKAFDELPPQWPWDHAIELVPGAILKDCKVYSLSIKEQEELDKFLDEYLKTGQIRLSKLPCIVPFFFVKKKDGSLYPVQDYCQLNEVTIKNKYPLLLIQELIDKVKRATYFIKLDIQ